MKIIKPIGWLLLFGLAGIQFIPSKSNQGVTNSPEDFIIKYKVPEDIGHTLITACYNCHSNHTDYPWYSRVQPVGLFLENHINEGKSELNFSEFGSYSVRRQKSKLESMIHQVEKNEMPLASYKLIHHDARLSLANKKELTDYLSQLKDSL